MVNNKKRLSSGAQPEKRSSRNRNHSGVVTKILGHDRLVKVNLITATAGVFFLIVNTAIVYFASQKHTNNIYFQVDSEGRMVEVIPVSQPNQSIPSVSSWLKGALEETFSMNFFDYKERLSENSALYFTESGGDQLVNALESSKSLDNIVQKEMWLSLTLDNPVFIKRGIRDGIYTWHFQVSGQLSKYNVSSRGVPDKVVFDIYIERMSEVERERGLGISRLVMDRL